MTVNDLIAEARRLGLTHHVSSLVGNPYWRLRGVENILMCAEDFAEAARHFAGVVSESNPTLSADLLGLAEEYEGLAPS